MRPMPILAPLLAALALLPAGCASLFPDHVDAPPVPANAVEATRTAANGDVISEYRVAGQLRMVRVQPVRGPAYYLMDSNDDGHLDRTRGEVSPVYYKLYGW
jgi:hypothetical protein